MEWTEPKPPTRGISGYDHVICETPLGKAVIEWKSWKDSPSYDIQLGNEWVGVEDSLDQAKNKARQHLWDIYSKLEEFLLPPEDNTERN